MPKKARHEDPLEFHQDMIDHLWNPFYRFGRSFEAPVNKWLRRWRPRRREGVLLALAGIVLLIVAIAITAESYRTERSLVILAATIPIGLLALSQITIGARILIFPPRRG